MRATQNMNKARPILSRTKKFVFDVRWVFIGSIIAFIIKFLQKPMIAYFVGPDGVGLWQMALVFSTVFALFGGWLAAGVPKFVAEYQMRERKLRALVWSGMFTSLFFGITTMLILFFCSDIFADFFNMPMLAPVLKIVSCFFPLSFIITILLRTLQGLRKMRAYSLFGVFQSIFAFCIVLLFLTFGFDVLGIAMGTLFMYMTSFCIIVILTLNVIKIDFCGYQKHTQNLMFYGIMAFIASLIGMTMIFNIDVLMIGYFLDETEVGYYSVAMSILIIMWMIPTSINTVFYPALAEYWHKKDKEAVEKVIDKCMKYSTVILFISGTTLLFFGQDVILILFGSAFIPSVLPLQILIIGTVLFGISNSVTSAWDAVGRPEMGVKINIICAIPNVILNYILIQIWGIIGAAVATTVTFALLAFTRIYIIQKLTAVMLDTRWFMNVFILAEIVIILFFISKFWLANLPYGGNYMLNGIFIAVVSMVLWRYFLTLEDKTHFISLLHLR
jgi:O-antigen/teichoic acid export membrane protein